MTNDQTPQLDSGETEQIPYTTPEIEKSKESFGTIERNSIVMCCALSLLLFFFPLLTIHVPIAGDQDVSGYDVFSKLTAFRDNLNSSRRAPESTPYTTLPKVPTPDLPLSIQLAGLISVVLIIAFISAAVALISAFINARVARIMCTIGACLSGVAILHITIMNSDTRSWLSESMKSTRADLAGNPFAGLAESLQTLMVNAFQIKPGWGVYALVVLLGVAAALGFSRVLARLRVAPISDS